MGIRRQLIQTTLCLLPSLVAAAQGTERGLPDVGIRRAFEHLDFDRPIWIGHPEDGTDRLFVAEQDGRIYWFTNVHNVRRMHEALDIRHKVRRRHEEEGLLGIAFHPTNRSEVFLHYSASDPRRNVVARFRMDAARERILEQSEELVLEVQQPWGNHNGGDLRFGPDGFLYITLGDGGSANDPLDNGQNLSTWLGSILRIDVDRARPYAVPPDNPFLETAGARGEIWAYGLRNVWRMSFDRATGELWAGDVGQNRYEEIDLIERGGNYGWDRREGKHAFAGAAPDGDFLDPVIEYSRREAQSITGGFVYRGKELPSLVGAYVHADYVTGFLWALWWDGSKVTRHVQLGRGSQITTFGEDLAGELYFASFDGAIYRLAGPIR